MSAEGLLQVDNVHPLDPESARLLERVGAAAMDLLAACMALPADRQHALLECRAFLFRRWVLEILLVARFQAPVGYGELSRVLGDLPSGSLSPKLKELTEAGVLAREETGDAAGRALYAVPERAKPLSDAVYAITHSHAWQHVAASTGAREPAVGDFSRLPSPSAATLEPARDAYAKAARAFAEHHLAPQTPPGFESALETATRFAEACDRTRQGEVVVALFAGSQTFSKLKGAVAIGDQALALTLRELTTLRHISRSENDEYALAPYGICNIAFGMGGLALLDDLRRSNPSA